MQLYEYEVTRDDHLQFNLHHTSHAPALVALMRRTRITAALLALVSVAAGGLLIAKWPLPTSLTLAVLLAAAVWLTITPFQRWFTRRTLRRMSLADQLGESGRHRLGIDAKGLHENAPGGVTHVPWDRVQRIDETPTHAFIYTGANAALILPKAGREPQVDVMLTQIRERMQPSTLGR